MNISKSSKGKLIEYSKELVRRDGITNINMRSLAQKSGLSVGTLYNYFPSKNELLLQVISSIWQEIFQLPQASFQEDSFLDAMETLFESVRKGEERYPNFFDGHPFAVSFVDRQKGSDKMTQFFTHLKEGLVQVIQRDSHIRPHFFSSEFTPEIYVDEMFQLFLYGISNEKEREILLLIEHTLYEEGRTN